MRNSMYIWDLVLFVTNNEVKYEGCPESNLRFSVGGDGVGLVLSLIHI